MDNDLARAISSTDANGLACQTDGDVDGSSSSDGIMLMLMLMEDPMHLPLRPKMELEC